MTRFNPFPLHFSTKFTNQNTEEKLQICYTIDIILIIYIIIYIYIYIYIYIKNRYKKDKAKEAQAL